MPESFPLVVTKAGPQPTPPATLRAALVALVAASNPGYTADLPGSLIEDIASTDTGALVLIDSARVETVNSLTPYGANEQLLNSLGNIYGVTRDAATNTSVEVQFAGTPGFVIAAGFTVGDGTHQYSARTGGIVGSGGFSSLILCIATETGTWAVPASTVTAIETSLPPGVILSCTNPSTGVPSTEQQSLASFRADVLQAGLATAQGMPKFLRTLLGQVAGVQDRLIGIRQQPLTGGWQVIVGGGDEYEVAYAIFTALFDISSLALSYLRVTGVTNANPGVVTVDLNHNYTNGQLIEMAGIVGMVGVNDIPLTITVVDEKSFSIGISTVASGTYIGGGLVTPDLRNATVTINDYPDNYVVHFVRPPLQTVAVSLTWDTNSPNLVPPVAVSQLGVPALANYINSILVGQPINLFELQNVFQEAVASLIPTPMLTRMVFAVSINGIGTSPAAGTGIIAGDPESYFFALETDITIVQG